jgi:Fungal specific transcription factor domain
VFQLGHFEKLQLSYSMSTNPTAFCPKTFPVPFSDSTFTVAVRDLVLGIPPRPHAESLFRAFFADVNWRFGIPQEWFEEACEETWKTVSISETGMEINVHWLCLFFAVLALAPQPPNAAPTNSFTTSDAYFIRSLSARRLAKDIYFTTPSFSPMTSAADGTVLSCLATPLLCAYLAEMGRVSEAWKLLGGSIRAAQAVGMHRDPGWQKWKVMSADEGLLRTTGWWGLVVWDRCISSLTLLHRVFAHSML